MPPLRTTRMGFRFHMAPVTSNGDAGLRILGCELAIRSFRLRTALVANDFDKTCVSISFFLLNSHLQLSSQCHQIVFIVQRLCLCLDPLHPLSIYPLRVSAPGDGLIKSGET